MWSGLPSITVNTVTGYASYFILSHYLHTYEISDRKEKIIYLLGLISFLITVIAMCCLSTEGVYASIDLFDVMAINILFIPIAVFVFFRKRLSKLKISNFKQEFTKTIAKYTFGIYLIHDFFCIYMLKAGIVSGTLDSLLRVPFIIFTIFMLSLLCVYIISKIPFINKFVI